MSVSPEGLEQAALDAARTTRGLLADAVPLLEGADAQLADDLTFATQALFRAELDQGEALRDRLREASAVMSGVLSRLHAPELSRGMDEVGAMLARGLATLYPARAGLERALQQQRASDPDPLGPPALAFERPLAAPGATRPGDPSMTPPAGRTPERVRRHALSLHPDPDAGLVDEQGRRGSVPPERRGEERAAFQVDIGLYSATQFFAGISGDLSEGGLFVATYTPRPVGTEVHVTFVLPAMGGVATSVQASAIVAWVRPPDGSGAEPGMGLRFLSLGEAERNAIERFMQLRPPMLHEP
jgi:uncharacterized protein (TIGR02266 family)